MDPAVILNNFHFSKYMRTFLLSHTVGPQNTSSYCSEISPSCKKIKGVIVECWW